MPRHYIGLGANLGPTRNTLRAAIEALRPLGPVRVARLYRTLPVGPPQPDFLNTALELISDAAETFVHERMIAIETHLGRVRREKWGPREIDLDYLIGPNTVWTATLKIPHPELVNRRFVLEPLADLAPDLIVPGLDRSVRELLERLPSEGVTAIEDFGWESIESVDRRTIEP